MLPPFFADQNKRSTGPMTFFKRILGLVGLALLSNFSGPLQAQSGSFVGVGIGPIIPAGNGAGYTFYVDNVAYTSIQQFRWQVGDVHTVRIPNSNLLNGSDGNNQNPSTTPVQDVGLGTKYAIDGPPSISYYDAAVQTPPAGAVQLFSQQANGVGETVLRIQMWSVLKSISWKVVRFHRLRFVTPSVGCAPTNSEAIPGACADLPGYTSIQSPGGTCYSGSQSGLILATNGDTWCPEGPVELVSVPAVGYAFKDWNSNPGLINVGALGVPGSIQFNLISPFTVQVNFGPGKFYRLATIPVGLDVIVDRSVLRTSAPDARIQDTCKQYQTVTNANGTPLNIGLGGDGNSGDFCVVWLFGSTRLLAATELQLDKTGKQFVFDSWSFGGGQNALFKVSDDNLKTDTITAKFLRAAGVSFITQPALRLPLMVSNRTWPHDNFWFGIGKEIPFSAPYESLDANGRRWRFKGWSNGGPASQTLKITQEMVDKGLYLVATYEPLNKVSVETIPPGLTVTIDGKDCQTPCVIEKLTTDTATVTPVPSVTQADVLRLEFANWTDGGPATRQVGFSQEVRRLVANYKPLYRFNALSNPPGNASFAFVPASPDGFYHLDTRVSVTVKAANGFRFRRWTGDTAGLFPTATVTVSGPRTVVAELEAVPYLDPAGIINSAGTGPQDQGLIGQVAPGSLITIYGTNLTPKEEIGPRSPMVQSLAQIVARVGDTFLPLSFASGNQINAQLPYDLAPGRQKLTLSRTGQADLSAEFEVVRNAPGLFPQSGTDTGDQPPLVFALRLDGSVVTEAAPAKPNETINLLGTGIGPFRNNPPLGFAVPSGLDYALADSVEVLAGDQVVQPIKVIATPGYVGMTSIQIKVGPQFPVGQSTTIRLRVNGKESNTVRLSVQ